MDKEKVRIKICGLRRREDILAVNRYLPDYAGFILGFPRSFRCISEDELADLTGMLDPRICPVGVFEPSLEDSMLMVHMEDTSGQDCSVQIALYC